MPRVEGGGAFVDGPSLRAFESTEAGVTDLVWNGWLPPYSLLGRGPDDRARVHGINVANRRLSVAAFASSMERLVAAARRCRAEDEVIALGRPVIPHGPAVPGAHRGERADIDGVDSDCAGIVRDTLAELDRIRARLAGRPLPLDVKPDLSVRLEVETEAGSCSVGASSPGGVSAGCRRTAGVGAGLGADGRSSWTAAAGPVSVVGTADRVESVELSHGPAYARLGRATAAVGVGVERELGTGPAGLTVSVGAKVGVEVRLLDAETVRRALSHEDFWAKKR